MIRSLLYCILLAAGGILVGQDSLNFGGIDLPGAIVRAEYRRVSPLAHAFSIEEVRRLPATFYDPARLIALLPGTVQTNDQANHLSVRGNTPNANLWRLNGLAIGNPNHTANAGTFYDLPTLNGGGVNALSAQVLDNSAFLAAGLPARYGNATGGTFDLRLRPGNKERRQYQAQASLIGFDAAAEGPAGKGGMTSYLANARYSFTGLLADAGVDFGGEEIRFGDLNVHLHRKLPAGEVSVFGVLGRNSNLFSPDPNEEVTEQKELFDIDYRSDIAIAGANFSADFRFGKLSAGAAYTYNQSARRQSFSDQRQSYSSYNTDLSRLSGMVNLEKSFGRQFILNGGIDILADRVGSVSSFTTDNQPFFRAGFPRVTSYAPYVSAHYLFGDNDIDVAIRPVWYVDDQLLNVWVIEPRLRYRRRWDEQRIVAILERNSQAPLVGLVLKGEGTEAFVPIANQAGLAYGRSLGGVSVLVSTYFQHTGREYAADVDGFLLSANNFLELDPNFTFTEQTATRRFGIELELGGGKRERGWYYRGNVSVFRAETEQRDGTWEKDRYSSDFSAKLTVGREWAGTDKEQRERTFGLHLALITFGGERAGLIIANVKSIDPYFTPPDYSRGFVSTNGTYFRPDLRLFRTKVRARTTRTIAVDLQNVAGISNTALTYYDSYLGRANKRAALGLIPVLSYRMVWR